MEHEIILKSKETDSLFYLFIYFLATQIKTKGT